MAAEPKKTLKFIELIIFILFALGPLVGNVILVLFGVLASDFLVAPQDILVAIPSFMFPFAIIQLFSGAISDVKGRIPVILFGLSIFGVGMAVAILSFSLIVFVVANVLAGIGFGFVNPVLIAFLTDITPGPKISKKIGLLAAVSNLGVGFGPFIGGMIIILNWRYMYVIFLGITLIGFFIIFSLRKIQSIAGGKDGIRTLFTHLSQEIRRLPVILLVLAAFLLSHTSIATIIWTSQAFTGVIPEWIAGSAIALFGTMGFIGGLITGILIKRKSVKYALLLGMISLFVADAILVLFGNNTIDAFPFISVGLLFMGIAGGVIITSVMFFSQTISPERRGALAGLTTASLFIGNAFVTSTLEPFFIIGGISLVYIVILGVSIILLAVLLFLAKSAEKKAY
ncbi:MAG: MFS transporter [Candidatus Lokiarchaeota archaeon]|nr:MFS transporter [Candidatus Lokiarchaeota archaeon]